MKTIKITTQKELDALPLSFDEYTRIDIVSTEKITVTKARGNSSVVAWGNSSVVAWGNSSVEARENSSVEARGNSSVEARGNSSVVAWGNSSVVAWENSSVEARENSYVVARENSYVVARENSYVVARENSSVVAWGNVGVHLFSDYATVVLFMFSVCWKLAKGKITKESDNATIITPKYTNWFDTNGIEKTKAVTLYKRVSKDFKTQEGTPNETLWSIGSTLEHPNWNPKDDECGEGKYHACSRPFFCDEFRSEKDDKYIALEVALADTYEWKNPSYPHKIAFRKGTVLYQCNKMGNKI